MNQSNKKNLEFIKNSGINYFLQDSPRNWFENNNKVEKQLKYNADNDKLLRINEVINSIKNKKTILQNSAKNLVVYD